jgi:hypothetical protein
MQFLLLNILLNIKFVNNKKPTYNIKVISQQEPFFLKKISVNVFLLQYQFNA